MSFKCQWTCQRVRQIKQFIGLIQRLSRYVARAFQEVDVQRINWALCQNRRGKEQYCSSPWLIMIQHISKVLDAPGELQKVLGIFREHISHHTDEQMMREIHKVAKCAFCAHLARIPFRLMLLS